ncbi:MAG TPA: anti-sigma factor [bacterium]|nr:anti-sigma factor [bacterium]
MRGIRVLIPTISLRGKAKAAAPAWLFCVALLVVELVLIVAIMTAASHRNLAVIYSQIAAQEPMLNLLNNASAKILPLTGRPGAGVRLVYDPGQKRGVLLIANLGDPGNDFSYRLWMVGSQGSRSAWDFSAGPDPLTIVPIKADFGRYNRAAIFVEHKNSSRSAPILFGRFEVPR